MNGEIVGFDLRSKITLDRLGERGEMQIADLSAVVAEQMVVRLYDLIKAIGSAVDVETVDHTCLVHSVEVIVDRCHCNAGHFQLCEEKDFIGSQMTVGMIENI